MKNVVNQWLYEDQARIRRVIYRCRLIAIALACVTAIALFRENWGAGGFMAVLFVLLLAITPRAISFDSAPRSLCAPDELLVVVMESPCVPMSVKEGLSTIGIRKRYLTYGDLRDALYAHQAAQDAALRQAGPGFSAMLNFERE